LLIKKDGESTAPMFSFGKVHMILNNYSLTAIYED